MTRRPCAGEPAFPSGDNLGANENGSAHAEAQGGSSQPAAPANGAANGVEHTTAADVAASYPVGKGVSDTVVLTALHNEIPLDQFTVPRLWYELKVRTTLAVSASCYGFYHPYAGKGSLRCSLEGASELHACSDQCSNIH